MRTAVAQALVSLFILGTAFTACSSPSQIPPVQASQPGRVHYVGLEGDDNNSGDSSSEPLATLQRALEIATAGDTIVLLPGEYYQDAQTVRSGAPERPIRIVGMPGAVLKGQGKSRIFDISHSYIELSDFTIDGRLKPGEDPTLYRDKLVYIHAKSGGGITGVRLLGMNLGHAAGECVRLKNQARHNEVAYSTIQHCGVRFYRFKRGKKNGEGIYIGTARNQLKPNQPLDISELNWIHHNVITTYGSECIDIKEGSQFNLIEHNLCSMEKDPDVAGISIRGNRNVIRYNTVFDNEGAGIRLGGTQDTDGIDNRVFHNLLVNNRAGGLKIMRQPQKHICSNRIHHRKGEKAVRTAARIRKEDFNQDCPDSL